MNQKRARAALCWVTICLCTASIPARADDSAAAIAAGGLVPRHETRIVMAKEVLKISPTTVVVDYDFRNDSDEDVTTEVAFPIPPYSNEYPEADLSGQTFSTFQLWIVDKPARYQIEAKAIFKDRDVTELLNANHIDIPTLGHFDDHESPVTRDLLSLAKPVRNKLIKSGLFEDQGDGDGYNTFARWTAHVQYHWTQTFPAHSRSIFDINTRLSSDSLSFL